MSVKVCPPLPPPLKLALPPNRNNKKRRISTTSIFDLDETIEACKDIMLTSAAAPRSVVPTASTKVPPTPPPASAHQQLTAQQRREALKLSFQRSISEPVGGVAGRALGVPCTPAIESPPSVSSCLHPIKRSRMMNKATPTSGSPCGGVSNLLAPPKSIEAGSVSLPTSPCSESSTLQRTLLLKNAKTIESNSLAVRLEAKQVKTNINNNSSSGSNFLLIDCRPFIAYNVNHIQGAINVNCCDRFNRKRLQQGKATLADLATTKEGKELLKKRNWREVVVYDDCSESLETLPSSHTLFLVMNALVEDHREPVMLLGGLRDFQVTHRALCEDHLMHSQEQNQKQALPNLLPDLPSPSDICDMKDIENHPATKVLPHLFLGNMRDASDMDVLSRLNIRYILNVTAKPPQYTIGPGFRYKHLEAADNGLQNIRQFFEEAFEFIDEAKENNTGVLVHCQAGISRSPTIAVAYLMKHYPMPMSDAYKFVKLRRSIISPNLNFMGQLYEFEQVLKAASGSISGSGTSGGNPDITKDRDNNDMTTTNTPAVTDAKMNFVPPGSTFADPNLGADAKVGTPVGGAGHFSWTQSSDVTKTVDGIYSNSSQMNGCSV